MWKAAGRDLYQSWSQEAIDLVERAVAKHGGWRRWESPYEVQARVKLLTGILPSVKGLCLTYPQFGNVSTIPSRCRTTFEDYPAKGMQSVFENGDVWISDPAGGVRKSEHHRQTFRGLRKYRLWSPLDAVYFFGYAIWHYHTLPFSLPECRLVRLCTAKGKGAPFRGVVVDLPPNVETHSSRQSFFFNEDGTLTRHDYVADVMGFWVRGAHFWSAFERRAEVLVATHRSVTVRFSQYATPIRVLHAKLEDVKIRDLEKANP